MKTILCVDDEPILHELLDLLIEERLSEMRLVVAKGASEARAFFEESLALCLIDVHMPGTGGLLLAKELRAAQPGCPIIVFSASHSPELEAEALAAGADRFVRKPFHLDAFLEVIDDLLLGAAGS